MVIDLPAGPNASGVGDFWQHSVTDMGQTGPDEGKGGKYLIVGPGQAEPPNTFLCSEFSGRPKEEKT